jgi:hypothetical protein
MPKKCGKFMADWRDSSPIAHASHLRLAAAKPVLRTRVLQHRFHDHEEHGHSSDPCRFGFHNLRHSLASFLVRSKVRTEAILLIRSKCFEMWWPGTELNRRRQPFQGYVMLYSQ